MRHAASGRAHHQLHDRALIRNHTCLAVHVAAVEHQADQASGLDDGVASMALDQEIGCSVDVEIGKHATGRALRGHRPRLKRQRIYDPDEKPVLIW